MPPNLSYQNNQRQKICNTLTCIFKFTDPCRSSYSHRRTASPRLPSVKNRRGSKAVEDTSAIGNLLASSLTSLTLGSLGLGGDGEGDQVRVRTNTDMPAYSDNPLIVTL